MEAPTDGEDQMLKRLVRFLVRYPMTANKFIKQAVCDKVRVNVDTDRAGCAVTMRSTAGLARVLEDVVWYTKVTFSRR